MVNLASAVIVRRYSSLASLLVLIGDYVLTCRAEFRFIWGSPINGVKYIYIFARYFALVVQTTSFFISQFYPLARPPVSPQVCNVWFMVLLVCCVVQLAAFDAVLMLQMFGQFPLPFGAWAREIGFDEVCSVTGTLHGGDVAGGVGVTVHLLLFYIIFRKRGGESEIVSFVIRGGAWCFVLVLSMVGVLIPYSYMDRTANPYIIFIWPITFFSITSSFINLSFTDVATIEFSPQVSVGSLGSQPEFVVDFLTSSLEVTNEPPPTESLTSIKAGTLQFYDPSDPKEFSAVDPDTSLKTESEI
ncbi:uncharacterized protein LACBIDRAFT_331360 [Laccaria bicolor S238N-H82]|uniref:Predicted protein n=1 Tax=Laccaria bicolor (strain S238N-H82 / ATCC MYA-4686) TaxID=486041 RepID=B0DP91_LACBS|nr:uncharacterized protein LACBIDRAFT_331360 [Laccaria bicolor S238N-H82]EDR03574.1 predicted protein [Laccaria bicolor S238N-H82]|eukprot:XP_001885722.1 predicted protein [Laccaria bicolor S238N-H82]